jgi:hypothetical protein
MQYMSTTDLQVNSPHKEEHYVSVVIEQSRPKHAVFEGLMALVADKRP